MEMYNDLKELYIVKHNSYIIAELGQDKEKMKTLQDDMDAINNALAYLQLYM